MATHVIIVKCIYLNLLIESQLRKKSTSHQFTTHFFPNHTNDLIHTERWTFNSHTTILQHFNTKRTPSLPTCPPIHHQTWPPPSRLEPIAASSHEKSTLVSPPLRQPKTTTAMISPPPPPPPLPGSAKTAIMSTSLDVPLSNRRRGSKIIRLSTRIPPLSSATRSNPSSSHSPSPLAISRRSSRPRRRLSLPPRPRHNSRQSQISGEMER